MEQVIPHEAITLMELTCDDRTFAFNRGLLVEVVEEDDVCSFESAKYNLRAFGDDRAEAESAFRHVFAACWDTIACEDDGRLTSQALKMKQALLSLVKCTK